jgi:hypothetical protein
VLNLPAGLKAIAVFGGRHPAAGDAEYAEALRLGTLLASANYAVMSGGYSGVMEAVSRGAVQTGETAIGVTMEIFGNLPPNPFLTQEIRARDFLSAWKSLHPGPAVSSLCGAGWEP